MRKGFGFHDRHSPLRFDPATLFIGGAIKGAFYDPSNITTLFQDDAGTTPVSAVEQTVGRILDLSGNGNHATQSVLASRPTLRARYNLVERSEEFNNAWWTKVSTTVSANAGTAPDGTSTADLIYPTTTGTDRVVYRNGISGVSAVSYTLTVYAKASGKSFLYFGTLGGGTGPTSLMAYFDLQQGQISQVGTYFDAVAIQNIGSGWYRCSATKNAVLTSTQYPVFGVADANNSGTATTNGTDGILIWGAQLLTATDVTTTGNAYQRVAAATSYDTSSPVWRPYLAFDGSNDSMLTGSIDFTGTDKMSVWAGVTKSSDAAQGVVAELSATIASNNGSFLLSAPNSAAANYNWSSKGTTQVDNTVTTYAAPNTAVLTGQANIAGPSNIIRVNGAQAGSVATTQGTGNFGNYPLYIGRRNNATLPLNGRLYGLIVLGTAASDWQVFAAEQWMAGKTGLQF